MEGAVLLAVMAFVLIGGAIWLTSAPPESEQEVIARRLTSYAAQAWRSSPLELSVLRRKRYSRIPWLDALLQRFDLAEGLARELMRAGVPMRVGEFVFVQVALAVLAGIAATLLLSMEGGPLLAAGPAAIVAFLAPLFWLRFKRVRRLNRFESALPDALDLTIGSLRAGYAISHGLDLVTKESSGPCAEEFGQMLQELNLGADLEVVLLRMVDRTDSEDARLLATAVSVQRRTGGNLIEVLSQMSRMIRDRLRLRRDVHVITTAPRVSGYVVSLLPILVAIGMFFTSRYYIEMLFAEPLGRTLAAIGGVWTLIGLYINHRIAKVEL